MVGKILVKHSNEPVVKFHPNISHLLPSPKDTLHPLESKFLYSIGCYGGRVYWLNKLIVFMNNNFV